MYSQSLTYGNIAAERATGVGIESQVQLTTSRLPRLEILVPYYLFHLMRLLCYFQAPWNIPEKKPESSWPDKGVIEFKDYQTRYREGLDLVLKGINCNIKSGEKIGQYKSFFFISLLSSSLFLSLFFLSLSLLSLFLSLDIKESTSAHL